MRISPFTRTPPFSGDLNGMLVQVFLYFIQNHPNMQPENRLQAPIQRKTWHSSCWLGFWSTYVFEWSVCCVSGPLLCMRCPNKFVVFFAAKSSKWQIQTFCTWALFCATSSKSVRFGQRQKHAWWFQSYIREWAFSKFFGFAMKGSRHIVQCGRVKLHVFQMDWLQILCMMSKGGGCEYHFALCLLFCFEMFYCSFYLKMIKYSSSDHFGVQNANIGRSMMERWSFVWGFWEGSERVPKFCWWVNSLQKVYFWYRWCKRVAGRHDGEFWKFWGL